MTRLVLAALAVLLAQYYRDAVLALLSQGATALEAVVLASR